MTTAWLNSSTNNIIQYFDSTGNVGIACSNPSQVLEVNGSGVVRSNLRVMGVAQLGSNISMSNSTGLANIYSSNAFVGINQATPAYQLDVGGSINAVGYCNLMINSFSNNSITNAPTCLALSNVYGMVVSTSNMAYPTSNVAFNSSNAIFPSLAWTSNLAVASSNTLYNKVITQNLTKSLDTSNPISTTLNWTTPYSAGGQYYIMLQLSQIIANQTAVGVKSTKILVGVSNYNIAYTESADVFGAPGIFTTLSTTATASNSTSVTLQSSTNFVGTGAFSHQFDVEIISNPQSGIGNVYLS